MFMLPILSLLGYFFAVKRWLNWSMEIIPLFVVSSLTTLLILLGYCNVLAISAQALILLGIALLLLAPWYIKRDDWMLHYLTPGFFFLILFSIFFGFFASHTHMHLWDEFAQWGARAKLIATQNILFSDSSVLARPDYPPGSAVFYYWFFAFSPYNEGLAHLAQQLLLLFPLGVLVKDYPWERWQRSFLVLSFAVLILLILHVRMATDVTLYVDGLIGLYFGIMLLCYYYSERKLTDIFFLIPTVFFFVSLKGHITGLLFFLCVILFIDQAHRAKHPFKSFFALLLLIVVGLISYWSWHIYLYWHHPSPQTIFRAWPTLPLSPEQFAVIGRFALKILKYLPTAIAILLVAAASVILAKNEERRHDLKVFHAALLIGFIFYLGILLCMYLFVFSTYESLHLASLPRYLKIYFVAWGLFAYGAIIPEWRESMFGQHQRLSGILIAIALIAFPTYLFYGHYRHHKNDIKPHSLLRLRQSLRPLVIATKKRVPPNGKIFLVWQNSKGFERVILGYELIPRSISPQPSSFGKPYAPDDIWTKNLTRWRLKRLMVNYDYVLLAYTDDPFWEAYGELFPDRRKHELIEYLICKRAGFNGFGQPGCWSQAATAYLYKH